MGSTRMELAHSAWTRFTKSAAAIPLVVAAYLLVLNMSLGRPIWIDEFLHFAVAAQTSTADAWRVIRNSIAIVNHGQTGIYMMLDYWLTSLFGANAIILRLPSILCGAFLLASSVWLIRNLRLSILWQLMTLAALLGQANVMYYAGEARPYMPLAAACIGILAYCTAPLHKRDSWPVRAMGLCSVILGTTTHPYFAVYWPVLCLVAYFHRCWSCQMQFGIRSLISHVNVALITIGVALYFLVALQTWLPWTLKGSPTFSYDPWQFILQPSPWVHFSDYGHFQFLYPNFAVATVGTVVAIVALALLPRRLRGSLTPLGAPVLLLVAAIVISVFLGWLSYIRNYWIVPRQWIASSALVVLAFVWLWAEVVRIFSRVAPALGGTLWVLPALLIAGQALRVHEAKLADLSVHLKKSPAVVKSTHCLASSAQAPAHDLSLQNAIDAWVELANRNIECGGAVWPVFQSYYEGYAKQGM